jgi:hypothetical protein
VRNGLIINEYRDKCWYKNDLLHRTEGPAIIYLSGTEVWYFEGKLHRTEGPAIICSDGRESYYLNVKYLTHDKWLIALGHKKESS